jgi:hypothetical protein
VAAIAQAHLLLLSSSVSRAAQFPPAAMNTLTLLSDAKYFEEGNARFAELRTLLDSKHSKEKLEAMKVSSDERQQAENG